jgi:hypothetical protein
MSELNSGDLAAVLCVAIVAGAWLLSRIVTARRDIRLAKLGYEIGDTRPLVDQLLAETDDLPD